MAEPAGPFVLAAYDSSPYRDMIAVNTSADVDFSNSSGPTAGVCPRGLYVTGNGAITFYALGSPGNGSTPVVATRTVTVGDQVFLPVAVAQINNTNTNATGIFACM